MPALTIASRLQEQVCRPEAAFASQQRDVQRFENCLRRLALCKPTFFRSTSRASRVTSPAVLNAGFNPASYSINAREMPWRTAPACPLSPPPYTDRKSTRLNSSHTVISYAVFCLKKKIEEHARVVIQLDAS